MCSDSTGFSVTVTTTCAAFGMSCAIAGSPSVGNPAGDAKQTHVAALVSQHVHAAERVQPRQSIARLDQAVLNLVQRLALKQCLRRQTNNACSGHAVARCRARRRTSGSSRKMMWSFVRLLPTTDTPATVHFLPRVRS